MGKSIRCKVKKRLRTAKRQRVDAMVCTPREQEKHEALRRVMEGRQVTMSRPKNAFKYPNEKDAVFPQHEIVKPIDFRSSSLPMAGYAFRGNRRKYDGEQKEYMERLAKQHPKMEVLAGGGVVLAATGQKISKHEAELLATQLRNPQGAAAAANPAAASSAVEAAVAEDEAGLDEPAGGEAIPEPANATNNFDHSRRPVLKDDRRAKRTAEGKARAKAVGRKGKVNPAATSSVPAVKKKGRAKDKANDIDKMQD
mmetsp:Transcript_62762/g.181963  ORF Transcript_62762/g.181963 Transcript_62762/m.181963 type:complete len:254 (-) Transcript_62762:94-855(-)